MASNSIDRYVVHPHALARESAGAHALLREMNDRAYAKYGYALLRSAAIVTEPLETPAPTDTAHVVDERADLVDDLARDIRTIEGGARRRVGASTVAEGLIAAGWTHS